jgi:hypothetical protein
LRSEIKISPNFAKKFENFDFPDELLHEYNFTTLKFYYGPKIRLTVTEDDFTEFSAYTITERTQRLDKKQIDFFEKILADDNWDDGDKTIKFPVYFYDSGSMMEWVFNPFSLACIAYWYGSRV